MTKSKSFGPSPEKIERERNERKEHRLWELIESDFSTLKRECKVDHPSKMETLGRLLAWLEDLACVYEALSETSEKSKN